MKIRTAMAATVTGLLGRRKPLPPPGMTSLYLRREAKAGLYDRSSIGTRFTLGWRPCKQELGA